jgi:hypothetical protein
MASPRAGVLLHQLDRNRSISLLGPHERGKAEGSAKNGLKLIFYIRCMLTTEVQQDTYTGPVTLNPRWLRIASAVKYSGLSRSRLYELLAQDRIRSIRLKSHNRALRGVRLVDRESIDLFMESLQEVVSKPIN